MFFYYALVIEYFGSNYFGWQKQPDRLSIQERLESVLTKIANEDIHVICAGRTDTGVHATSQVINFKTTKNLSDKAWTEGVNSLIPKDIAVQNVYRVDENFSSRFSAISRRYNYVIYNNKLNSPIVDLYSLWERRNINIDLMNKGCSYLQGKHDFNAFRSSQCQSKSSIREIKLAKFSQKNNFIVFDISGNAFLHHMVRNIVGSLLEVGIGKRSPEWIKTVLESKDRNLAGKKIAAKGLYLVEVCYPEETGVLASKNIDEYFC